MKRRVEAGHNPYPYRRSSVGCVFLLVALLLSVDWWPAAHEASAQQTLFIQDEDVRWAAFQREPCRLIEGVPIVPRMAGVSPVAAGLSSIVGYYEHEYPAPGGEAGMRIEQLVAMPFFGTLNRSSRAALVRTIEANATRHRETFISFAQQFPMESDGVIRSRMLEKLYGRNVVEDTLGAFAADRYEAPRYERMAFGQFQPIRNAIENKQPVMAWLKDTRAAYPLVGYFERAELLIAIDANSAKSRVVAAADELLTERDRNSSKEFASQARALLSGRSLVVDEVTSCTGSRPLGLRFVRPNELVGRAEMYVIHGGALEEARLLQFLPRRP